MAIRLSRVGGVSFGGVTVDNTNDVFLLNVYRNATPKMRFTELRVPKRNGTKRYDDAYDNKEISVTIGVFADTMKERREKVRHIIMNWVGKEDRLFFADDATLFYDAKVYDEIKTVESEIFTELTVTFDASPFLYGEFDDTRDLTVAGALDIITNEATMITNNHVWQGIKTTTNKVITNSGTHKAWPIFIINGTATKVAIEIGDLAFSFNNLANETIYIDSEKMICYNDTITKKVSRLVGFRGKFPVVNVGENNVKITGTAMNVDVEIKYRNTYIV